jgi:hypothetical protein
LIIDRPADQVIFQQNLHLFLFIDTLKGLSHETGNMRYLVDKPSDGFKTSYFLALNFKFFRNIAKRWPLGMLMGQSS